MTTPYSPAWLGLYDVLPPSDQFVVYTPPRTHRQDPTGPTTVATHPEPGILTYSGRFIPVDGGEVPSLMDIATSLRRHPRFGGNCRREWSVLDHSLFVARLAEIEARDWTIAQQRRQLILAALLHDAHEAITGDIPTHFKTASLRDLQARLDQRIMGAYYPGGYTAYCSFLPDVERLDHRALLAEAMVVGPSCLKTPADVERYFGEAPREEDTTLLRLLPLMRSEKTVQWFLDSVLENR